MTAITPRDWQARALTTVQAHNPRYAGISLDEALAQPAGSVVLPAHVDLGEHVLVAGDGPGLVRWPRCGRG